MTGRVELEFRLSSALMDYDQFGAEAVAAIFADLEKRGLAPGGKLQWRDDLKEGTLARVSYVYEQPAAVPPPARVIVATAFIRGLDEVDEIGEEGWRVALAFADDTPEEAVKAAILARLQDEMSRWGPVRFRDLTMEGDMGFDDPGRVCWQMSSVEVLSC